jgi:hypothetical protein
MTRKNAAEAPTLFAAPEAPKPARAKPAAAKAQVKADPKPQRKPKPDPQPKQEVATVVPMRKDTPANTLAVIADAMKLPDFKPENMRALLDMHKEMVAEQARLDFIGSFHAMKRELPVINRDGKIVIVAKDASGRRPESGGRVQQSTPYATFENISRQIDPILDRNGFNLSHSVEPEPGGARIVVTSILEHVGGHSRVSRFPLPAETSGSKNNVQGWGSAISYGKRYNTIMLLNIRTSAPEDRDTDGHRPKFTKGGRPQVVEGEVLVEDGRTGPSGEGEAVITQAQEDALRELLETAKTTPKKFGSARSTGRSTTKLSSGARRPKK